jgi:hypothetical protein
VTPGLLAPHASAADGDPGWFDWLIPPSATPAPAPSATTATPTPSPSDTGFSLPGLGKLQLGSPGPPTPPGTPKETSATCPADQLLQPGGATRPGESATDAAEVIRQCLGAAEEGIGLVSGAAPPPPAGTPKISNERLTLKATKLTMKGLSYEGLNTMQSTEGPVKVMHFAADSVEVQDLNQSNPFDGGGNVLKNIKGAAVLKGHVNLYVTSMDAKIFGLLPLKFDPKFQPPLVFEQMFFTDATTIVRLVTCDEILLPSLELKIS